MFPHIRVPSSPLSLVGLDLELVLHPLDRISSFFKPRRGVHSIIAGLFSLTNILHSPTGSKRGLIMLSVFGLDLYIVHPFNSEVILLLFNSPG